MARCPECGGTMTYEREDVLVPASFGYEEEPRYFLCCESCSYRTETYEFSTSGGYESYDTDEYDWFALRYAEFEEEPSDGSDDRDAVEDLDDLAYLTDEDDEDFLDYD